MSCPYCTEPFYPKKVAPQLALQSNKIHPALCFGRNDPNLNDSSFESFVMAFFITRNDDELKLLWENAEKVDMEEVHICFFKKEKDGCPTSLSDKEMKEWDFSVPWSISRTGQTGWDELREVPIGYIFIEFE